MKQPEMVTTSSTQVVATEQKRRRFKSRLAFWRETSLTEILRDVWSFLLFAWRRFQQQGMGQAAGALTFSTLLALVPLLVITVAVLTGFPAFDTFKSRLQDLMLGALLPEVGTEVRAYLEDFMQGASNLTALGVIALAATAIMLLSTIETTLNRVWNVERARPMLTRFLIFWAILTVGPLLLGASFSLTTNNMEFLEYWKNTPGPGEPGSVLALVFNCLIAFVAQSAAFTMIFVLVPARSVRIRDAAIGGFFAGIGFQVLRWAFDTFLTSGSTYATIYGAVAVIPIFLLWIYLSWTVIILGAVLSASFPDWWQGREAILEKDLSPGETLTVAMAILAVLLRNSTKGQTVERMVLADAVPMLARDAIVEKLKEAGYVVETVADRLSLVRSPSTATVADLAEDLGLSLGIDGATSCSSNALNVVSKAVGNLPVLLSRLALVETETLSIPISIVLGAAPPEEQSSTTIGMLSR